MRKKEIHGQRQVLGLQVDWLGWSLGAGGWMKRVFKVKVSCSSDWKSEDGRGSI